jgi:cyclopropane fatty-acyl-phospholipid synthase-like methyltransferase
MAEYNGHELKLFAFAENWKKYFSSYLKPFIKGRVLEVGAGIGGTTRFLCSAQTQEWICLEPDPTQVNKIKSLIEENQLPAYCQTMQGTTKDLMPDFLFDTIIYIDVLEHIQDDASEILHASKFLKSNGYLIILSPAYPWLFSSFDKSIGHFRRYTIKTLRSIIPDFFQEVKLFHVDSVGLLTSLMNKFVLHQRYPTEHQIKFWDRWIIPMSRIIDFLLLNKVGRSIVGIWQKK